MERMNEREGDWKPSALLLPVLPTSGCSSSSEGVSLSGSGAESSNLALCHHHCAVILSQLSAALVSSFLLPPPQTGPAVLRATSEVPSRLCLLLFQSRQEPELRLLQAGTALPFQL